jgi:hypothetical protein
VWEALSYLVDLSRPWLVGGDFNMVLYLTDQLGGLSGAKAAAWALFPMMSLSLFEYFPAAEGAIQYT